MALSTRDVPWVRVHGLLMPDIPPHVRLDIDHLELGRILAQKRALGALWTFDWDCPGPTGWWWMICDDPEYDIERLPNSNARRKVRAGLARTRVERIEPAWFATHGYALYQKAHGRYSEAPLRSPEGFRGTIENVRVHPGDLPWEFWGGFDAAGHLVAAAYCRLQPPCMNLSAAMFDPDARSAYPMNAMYYTIARHYLRDRGFGYVESGSRPLLHRTNVEEFRLGLGWRQCWAKLGAMVVPPLGVAATVYQTTRGVVSRLLPPDNAWMTRADSLSTLLELARGFEESPVRRLLYL